MKQLTSPGNVRVLRDRSRRFRSDPARPFELSTVVTGVLVEPSGDWWFLVRFVLADGGTWQYLYGDGSVATAVYYFSQVYALSTDWIPPFRGGLFFNYSLWDRYVSKTLIP